MQVKITRKAYQVICEESFSKPTETGGEIIGTIKTPIVIAALTPGVNAELSYTSFKPDAEYDNQNLQRIIKQYEGRVKLLGYWHKHPGRLSTPSMGDCLQAKEIVKELSNENDNYPYYVFIANVIDNEVKIYAYSLQFNEKEFKRLKLVIIDDDSEEIQNALTNESATIIIQETDFWSDRNFQFYLTETGKTRLEKEIQEIQRHYKVEVFRQKKSKRLLIRITKDSISLTCVPPVEYPLNPPSFYNSNKILNLSPRYWNSDIKLLTLVESAFNQISQEANSSTKKEELKDESLYFEPFNKRIKKLANEIRQICRDFWHGKRV